MGVDGMGVADAAPTRDFPRDALPRLTVTMVARLQGFPDQWEFTGRKTAAYRQVGNAFPPLVARAVGLSIVNALKKRRGAATLVNGHAVEMRLLEKVKEWGGKWRVKKVPNN